MGRLCCEGILLFPLEGRVTKHAKSLHTWTKGLSEGSDININENN